MSNIADYESAWKDGDEEKSSDATPGAIEAVGKEKSASEPVTPEAGPVKDEYVAAHEELSAKEKPASGEPLQRAVHVIASLQSAFENAKANNLKHFSHEGKTYSTEEGEASAPATSQKQEPETAAAKAAVKRD